MELERIKINEIETSAFRNLESANINTDDKVTVIVGRNGTGKSTTLNAITWAIMGLDLYGNRIDPFQMSGPPTTWVKLETTMDGKPTIIRRIIQEKPNGKTETTVNLKLDVDKELFYSLINPRYFQSRDPKEIKAIIAKAVQLPTSMMESGMSHDIISAASEYVHSCSYEKIVAVEEGIKAVSAKIKELEKGSLIHQGKIEGVDTIRQIFAENEISVSEEVSEALDMTVDGAKALIEINNGSIEQQKAISKKLNAYRTSAYEALATELNSMMKDVQIMLNENGKEVFIVTYKGKNVRACSNSEQLLAGLELVNALAEATGFEYPVLVDNAECILNIDPSDYPNIHQFIFAVVADENLSIWDGGMLQDIKNGTLMPRSKEQLTPSVKLLEGWGAKSK
jgi:hypothetical protein